MVIAAYRLGTNKFSKGALWDAAIGVVRVAVLKVYIHSGGARIIADFSYCRRPDSYPFSHVINLFEIIRVRVLVPANQLFTNLA